MLSFTSGGGGKSDISKKLKIDLMFFQPQSHEEATRLLSFLAFFNFFFIHTC